ncbi:MAG TPA: response regulator transcription factor [Fimbriimonadales bacterium]|nr:response regulator transcription factor [Fimbriimonadales bacterium]
MVERIRVVVADNEESYRKAFQQVLSCQPDIELLELARDGIEATRLEEEKDTDVLLKDIEMPRMDGIECIWQSVKRKHDGVPVILTVHKEEENVLQAIRAGTNGYLLKTNTSEEVVITIRRIECLQFTEKTVKTHVGNISKSLYANSRTEVAMKAVREKSI